MGVSLKASAVLQLLSVSVVSVVAAACVGIAPTASTQPTSAAPTGTASSVATTSAPPVQTPTVTVAPATATTAPATESASPSPMPTTPPSASASASASAVASPAGPISLVDGTANVTVSGDANETFELATQQVGTYTPGASSSVVEATWSNEDLSRLMRLTIDVDAVGVVLASSAFVAIGLGGSSIIDETTYFPDAFRSACMVIVIRLDATGVEGSFTCTDLTSVDESQT